MRRFRFKLERLLELRAYREHEWKIKLGEITGKCVSLKAGIRDRKKQKSLAFKGRVYGDILSMRGIDNYISRLMSEMLKLEERLSEAEKIREEVRTDYLKASKKRKVLDKLKEKRGFDFRKEQLSKEIKAADDINTGAAVRRNMK